MEIPERKAADRNKRGRSLQLLYVSALLISTSTLLTTAIEASLSFSLGLSVLNVFQFFNISSLFIYGVINLFGLNGRIILKWILKEWEGGHRLD